KWTKSSLVLVGGNPPRVVILPIPPSGGGCTQCAGAPLEKPTTTKSLQRKLEDFSNPTYRKKPTTTKSLQRKLEDLSSPAFNSCFSTASRSLGCAKVDRSDLKNRPGSAGGIVKVTASFVGRI